PPKIGGAGYQPAPPILIVSGRRSRHERLLSSASGSKPRTRRSKDNKPLLRLFLLSLLRNIPHFAGRYHAIRHRRRRPDHLDCYDKT
ncbi:MAG: hypothetical protein ACRD9Y_08135, partial [Blastocatellia bacterium]